MHGQQHIKKDLFLPPTKILSLPSRFGDSRRLFTSAPTASIQYLRSISYYWLALNPRFVFCLRIRSSARLLFYPEDAVRWFLRNVICKSPDCTHRHALQYGHYYVCYIWREAIATLKRLNLQAPRVLYIGQTFRYSPENAFYIFNQQTYFIIWYMLDRASLI